MGKQGQIGDRLRQRLRDEREHHGWSQAALAAAVRRRGLLCHETTIAKIEAGSRAVRVDELTVLSEIFTVSIDMLVGRNRSGELAWAAGNLTAAAQKMATEIDAMRSRLASDRDDLVQARTIGGSAVDNLLERAVTSIRALAGARDCLNGLADQFPIPT